jgi:hypothetical protein
MPSPTDGNAIGREVVPNGDRPNDPEQVRVGWFGLDAHSTGVFNLWPSWTQQYSTLAGVPRVDDDGREARYGSLSDAMGAARDTEGNQAVVERAHDSFAVVDLAGSPHAFDDNSGVRVALHVENLGATNSDPAVRAVEYGASWLARTPLPDDPDRQYWVKAAVRTND